MALRLCESLGVCKDVMGYNVFMHQFNTSKLPKIFYSFLLKRLWNIMLTLALLLGLPSTFQKFERIMANLIFHLMDLRYGMKLMKDSNV